MKKLMFILALILTLSGCEKKGGEATYEIYRRSFAMKFYETAGLELNFIPYPDADETRLIFEIKYGGDGPICEWRDTGEKKETYDALCEKYGDMTYNREEFVFIGGEPSFLAYSPVSIEIVSNHDFDEEHPAGTSLGDLVSFYSYTAKPYIDSGYVEYDWGVNPGYVGDGKQPFYPIDKKVSELTQDDLMLLYGTGGHLWYIYLKFDLPTLSKQHRITVTFTDERGRTFSDTIAMNFE
jgi:hypothetical protein